MSALEAGPNGWVQRLNFVVFGLLTIAFAVGLDRGLQRTRAGVLGPALLFVSGVGGIMFFLSSALGLIVVSRRAARDPRWRSIATYTVVAGALTLAGFVVMGALVRPDDAPPHEWAGLGQRVLIILVLFPCRIALALRLLQIGRG